MTEILRGENEKAKAAALVPHRGIGVLSGLAFVFTDIPGSFVGFLWICGWQKKAAIGAERSGISRIVTACRSLTDLTRSVVGQALPLSLAMGGLGRIKTLLLSCAFWQTVRLKIFQDSH